MPRPIVILESPFRGDQQRNVRYARACMKDCISRGETPLASHLLYTQPGILDDLDPVQRELGIQMGFQLRPYGEITVFYTDLGFSNGMTLAMKHCMQNNFPFQQRKLPGWTG